MDYQLIAGIVFVIILTILLYKYRKQIEFQKVLFPIIYFAVFRTKLGIKQMDSLAKRHPKFWEWFGFAGIVVGFLGMALIAWLLIDNLIKIITTPTAVPGVSLVLPFKVKGTFFVPFFYWIISIFIIATVHEFCHGVIARLYKMKVKSSGFAFLGIILPVVPAAFVEPDEKEVVKRPHKQQLAVFVAGSFSNIVLAGIILLLSIFLITPAIASVVEFTGVEVVEYAKGNVTYPVENAGIGLGERIVAIDGVKIEFVDNLTDVLKSKKPNEDIIITTNKTDYNLTLTSHPENSSKAYLGASLTQAKQTKPEFEAKYGKFIPAAIIWIAGLFYWLYVLNLGIGLFNLVPLGPIDGGRMMQLVMHRLFKDKEKGNKAWKWISVFFLALILVNLMAGFFK